MAERSVVRELVTLFGFEADEKQLSKIDKAVHTVATNLRRASIAATAFGAAVGYVTYQIANEGAELVATSRKLKLSTDALQEWRYAAQLAGVEVATMNGAMDSFSARVGMAARGQGPAVQALGRLGIEVRDTSGNIRDLDTLLTESFVALSGFAEGAERAELAAKLFNMSGADLILLLEGGADGLARMRKEAHLTGGVMSHDLALQGKDTAKAWLEFHMAVKAVRNVLASEFLPSLTRSIREWGQFIARNKDLVAILGKVGLAVMALRIPLALLGAQFAVIIAGVAAVALMMEDVSAFAGGRESVTGMLSDSLGSWVRKGLTSIMAWIKNVATIYIPGQVIDGLSAISAWLFSLVDRVVTYLAEKIDSVLPSWARDAIELARFRGEGGVGQAASDQQQLANSARRFAMAHGMESQNPQLNVTINAAPGQSPQAIAGAVALTYKQHMNANLAAALQP